MFISHVITSDMISFPIPTNQRLEIDPISKDEYLILQSRMRGRERENFKLPQKASSR